MRTTWKSKTLIMVVIGSSLSSASSHAGPKCLNLSYLGWRIVQRLGPAKYEAIVREGSSFCGNTPGSTCVPIEAVRVMLVTMKDDFQSEGVIQTPLWVEDTDKNPERTEMALANGFKRKFRVVRETSACSDYGRKFIAERERYEKKEQQSRRSLAAQRKAEEIKEKQEQKNNEKQEREALEKAAALWK